MLLIRKYSNSLSFILKKNHLLSILVINDIVIWIFSCAEKEKCYVKIKFRFMYIYIFASVKDQYCYH